MLLAHHEICGQMHLQARTFVPGAEGRDYVANWHDATMICKRLVEVYSPRDAERTPRARSRIDNSDAAPFVT